MSLDARRHALAELAQRKSLLQKVTCSDAWFALCWEEGGKFPPAAETTPMQPCSCDLCQRLGKLWPAHYLHDLSSNAGKVGGGAISYECYLESLDPWEAAQLPSSPSGLALRAIREGRIKLRREKTRLGRRRHH